nr:hypothetical protein [Deltaproteobacteria bacterium]
MSYQIKQFNLFGSGFFGIGCLMQQKILDILKSNGLGSPEAIVRISNEALRKIKGIGNKAIQEIRQQYGPPLIGWPVDEQCRFLGIPYQKHKAKWDTYGFDRFNWYCEHKKDWVYPEDFVLNRYIADGWQGVNCEGRFIHTILKLLTQNELSGYWTSDYFYLTEAAHYSDDNLKHHQKRLQESIPNFQASTEKDLIERFEHCKNPQPESDEYGRPMPCFHHATDWSTDLIVGAYRALGKEVLFEILRQLIVGGEKRRYGWPDLTIVKNGQIKFIEVKTIDRLGKAQIELWDCILKPLA